MSVVENPDGVPEPAAQTLRVIASAMAGGVVLMCGLTVWCWMRSEGKAPDATAVRLVNTLTTVAMLVAVSSIVASEILWRTLLRTSRGPLAGRVQSAYIARLALREGAALMGMTVCYIAALNGVLRAYPAYWATLVPAGLFFGFLAAHWPTAERLTAEALEAVGNAPVSPQ